MNESSDTKDTFYSTPTKTNISSVPKNYKHDPLHIQAVEHAASEDFPKASGIA